MTTGGVHRGTGRTAPAGIPGDTASRTVIDTATAIMTGTTTGRGIGMQTTSPPVGQATTTAATAMIVDTPHLAAKAVTPTQPPPPPPTGTYYQVFSGLNASIEAPDFLTFGLVDTVSGT